MIEIIWGLKTVAIFDLWTFVHVFIGISVGSAAVKKKQNAHFWHLVILVLVLAIYVPIFTITMSMKS